MAEEAQSEGSATEDQRPEILVLSFRFCRGIEATGPNQSLLNMARALPEYRFRFIGSAVEGDTPGIWGQMDGLELLPLAPSWLGRRGLRSAIRDSDARLILLNSFFDPRLSLPVLMMRRFGRIPRIPVLLAPRGEFFPPALAIKPGRKRLHIQMVRRLGLLKKVSIQATSEEEAARIREVLPFAERILLGPNVRSLSEPPPPHRPRAPGEPLRIAFVGRISPIKNLDFAIRAIARSGIAAVFDIYGPAVDPDYFAHCRAVADEVTTPQLTVNWRGEIPNREIMNALAAHDLLFQPSASENYGHAIVEAMLAGTPVLTSDGTPWRGLEAAGAGWDLPLADKEAFARALRESAGLASEAALAKRVRTRSWAEQRLDLPNSLALLRDCLEQAMRYR